jgi:uncharacterized membrane protein YfcA
MDLATAGLLIAAGIGAGTANAIVGSGSLVTFPTLLLLGYPPLVANVSNTVGLVPGSLSASYGYRGELGGQRSRAVPVLVAGGAGGLTGAVLLLVLPPAAFATIVPALILFACALVIVQPRLSRWVAAHPRAGPSRYEGGAPLVAGVFLTGVYGGYFGAGQGVILIALLSTLLVDRLQRLNALKNAIAAVINGIAALLFLVVAPVDLQVAVVIAIGATLGGLLGARIGRRLPPAVLRGAIVLVGAVVAIRLMVQG